MKKMIIGFLLALLGGSSAFSLVLNNPYPKDEDNQKIYYTSFTEQPKTLDPARSYSSNEYQFIAQIYEPLLEYDYLLRPYELVPLSAASMPEITYLDAQFKPIAKVERQKIAYSVYTLHLKTNLYYQPHPALARDANGQYRYLQLSPDYLAVNESHVLSDFAETGTRKVLAEDFIYQVKRLADPRNSSPIYGLMSEYILGFKEFAQQLPASFNSSNFVDLRQYPLLGLKKVDDYTFQIIIKGQYPQFIFWLAMPFFSPIPWEADQFYAQPGMRKNNLSLGWYPIGSGPFMLIENNPNRQMILQRNPNYRKPPYLDAVIYTLEKESIPRWNKFLQGYYDMSVVSTDSFDQVIEVDPNGRPALTAEMQDKNIRLINTIESNVFYMGFNMLDPVVGGKSERARLLRLAISIAVNLDEYIAIFYNGRGQTAQGPLPPGIQGYQEGPKGINSYVYQWQGGHAVRRGLKEARQLMVAAGYPHGRDPKTGRSLVLNYDITMSSRPDEKAQFDWMRKQFAQLGIDLNIRATEYNRFQEKMRTGNAQIFYWGWNADYPDPENFLLLLYGPHSKARHGGENAANYQNSTYDQLFGLMKNRPNDEIREKLIEQMVEIVRHDAPWIWGINPEMLTLSQEWINRMKPNAFSYNTLKYMDVNVVQRNELREQWNQAVFWPIIVLIVMIILIVAPFFVVYHQREKQGAKRAVL